MKFHAFSVVIILATTLISCKQESSEHAGITRVGTLENILLDEASGIQPSPVSEGVYFLHNDDGAPEVFAIDDTGRNLGSFVIDGAANRDWEDITVIDTQDGPYLVLADTGDNFAIRDSIHLYFTREPEEREHERFYGKTSLAHQITLQYPDGARDCESIAFDASSNTLYLMSKRDKPARLYSIPVHEALQTDQAVLKFEGEVARLRPASMSDAQRFGSKESKWISQPTGMDINHDGSEAVVITYRSIYLFRRNPGEDWPSAFSRKPVEFIGPPDRGEEAVAYARDGQSILATAEGVRAPVFRFWKIKKQDQSNDTP